MERHSKRDLHGEGPRVGGGGLFRGGISECNFYFHALSFSLCDVRLYLFLKIDAIFEESMARGNGPAPRACLGEGRGGVVADGRAVGFAACNFLVFCGGFFCSAGLRFFLQK